MAWTGKPVCKSTSRIKQSTNELTETMKKFLSTIIVAMVWVTAWAVPARPMTFIHTQSDGKTVTLTMRGGEFHHSLTTLDGLTVSLDHDGNYCYTVAGSLSNVIAHDAGDRGIEETALITVYQNVMTPASGATRMPRREEENPNPQVPTIGSPRIPIILVNYTDVQFVDENPIATFENQFNEMDRSCLHYFQSQSRGLFSPQFDILGPVTMANDRAFYGNNIHIFGTDCDKQIGTMVLEACQGVDSNVNFTDYDNDGDGLVDVVVVLYAGVGEAQAWQQVPESVWPCQWDMKECFEWGCSTSGPFELDGVTIDKFAVFNELDGNNNYTTTIDGIGTFCHEFSHCLGLPDFYPTNGGYYYGMSNWSLMDNGCYLDGGHTPAGYTSYERHFMGWMELIDPIENTRYELAPLNSQEGTAVKVVNDANPDEYYLLEYRTQTDWDQYIPAEGILIIHVDYDQATWDNNTPNNISSHQRMTIIPADNKLSTSTNRTDTWPYGELDSLTNNSTPAATVFTGDYMNKPITQMTVDSENGMASLWYMKAKQPLPGDVNGDGEVNIADVNVVIDCILQDGQNTACDVNGDGEVNIADVNAIISLILNRN